MWPPGPTANDSAGSEAAAPARNAKDSFPPSRLHPSPMRNVKKRNLRNNIFLCFHMRSHFKGAVLHPELTRSCLGRCIPAREWGVDTQVHVETILYLLSGPSCDVATSGKLAQVVVIGHKGSGMVGGPTSFLAVALAIWSTKVLGRWIVSGEDATYVHPKSEKGSTPKRVYLAFLAVGPLGWCEVSGARI